MAVTETCRRAVLLGGSGIVQEAVGCSYSLGTVDVFTVLKGQTIFLFPCLLQRVLLNILIIRCGISSV